MCSVFLSASKHPLSEASGLVELLSGGIGGNCESDRDRSAYCLQMQLFVTAPVFEAPPVVVKYAQDEFCVCRRNDH